MSASFVTTQALGACALSLGLCVPASAQGPLDVERYVQIVLRTHPAARQSAGLEDAARAERKAARLLPDPVLEFFRDRGRLTEAPGTRGTETGISATQTIPWPGTFAAGVRAADRQADALRSSAEAIRWGVEIQARDAFWRLLSARALVEIAGAAEQDARSLRDLVARRTELGESRESDRIKTTVEWLRQQRNLASAEREEAAAEAIVRALAVEPLPRPLAIQGKLPPPPPPQDGEALRARLLDRNPQLRAARAQSERQRALLSVARRGRVPDLDVTVFREKELDKEANGFSVGLKVPLWNANRGQIARAQADARIADAEAVRARLDLTTDFESRLKELEIAAKQTALLDGEILPAATNSLNLARFSYEEGETSLLDLLDAQRTFRETQRETVEARLALALAVGEMQRLLGPDFMPWRQTNE